MRRRCAGPPWRPRNRASPALFDDLVRETAASLQVAVAFVAVYADEAHTRLRSVAGVLDGKPLRPFEYPLEGTPCAQVVGTEFRFVERGMAREFKSGTIFAAKGMDSYAAYPLCDGNGFQLGLLVAMDRPPLADAALAEAVLKIIGSRIAVELERASADAVLRTAALAVSNARGASVFAELVRYLATILRVDMAFIAEARFRSSRRCCRSSRCSSTASRSTSGATTCRARPARSC